MADDHYLEEAHVEVIDGAPALAIYSRAEGQQADGIPHH